MTTISNRDAAAILQQARETLARTSTIETRQVVDDHPILPPIEDRIAKWKREADEQTERKQAERERSNVEVIERRVEQRVRAALQGMIDQAIGAEREHLIDLFLPELVAAMRAEISGEITSAIERAYEKALGNVRADLNALRASIKRLGGDGTILDLPALSLRGPALN
jgi:hypothetical protein